MHLAYTMPHFMKIDQKRNVNIGINTVLSDIIFL